MEWELDEIYIFLEIINLRLYYCNKKYIYARHLSIIVKGSFQLFCVFDPGF